MACYRERQLKVMTCRSMRRCAISAFGLQPDEFGPNGRSEGGSGRYVACVLVTEISQKRLCRTLPLSERTADYVRWTASRHGAF